MASIASKVSHKTSKQESPAFQEELRLPLSREARDAFLRDLKAQPKPAPDAIKAIKRYNASSARH